MLVAVLAGCQLPRPALDRALTGLVTGLESGYLAGVATTGTDPTADYSEIVSGMDGIRPEVTPGDVQVDGDTATVPLHLAWPFPAGTWEYGTTATLRRVGREWQVDWLPTLVHPSLTDRTRLVHRRIAAQRGNILGANGTPIVAERQVFVLGLDKSTVGAEQVEASARAIAKALDIDADRYTRSATAAGPQAFVEALTIRADTPQVAAGFLDIPGARVLDRRRPLAPTATFASGLLGTVGTADQQRADASGGTIRIGDSVGVGGLQERYDDQLRGTPGDRVIIVPRGIPAGEVSDPHAVFNAAPTPGVALQTTLDVNLQQKAEKALAKVKGSAAIVAVDAPTGKILAAATARADGSNPTATYGRAAPGSTFKVVSALALLRSGLSPDSTVDCPATTTVDGRVLKNYSDFPSGRVGTMTLTDALATSCNTAFVGQADRVDDAALADAAASLGVGRDHDVGFPAFYGSVPAAQNTVGHAEAMFGQGLVEVSPMAMAGVAASVRSGQTVLPWLVDGHRPTSDATALSAEEAGQLRAMMGAVVKEGTARGMSGVLDGAKTGTAEYGTATPPATHAWMIGYRGDLAVAVYVADGESGSATGAPLLRAFLGK